MNVSDPFIVYWWLAPKYFEQLSARPLYSVVMESAVMITINVVTLCGNSLVCFALCRNPKLLTSTNLLILSFAATDLLNAIVFMPWTTYILVNGKWIKPIDPLNVQEVMCRFQGVFAPALTSCSLHMMALTAINRYLCVVKQTWFKKLFTRNGTLRLIVGEWVIIYAVASILPTSGLANVTLDPRRAACFITLLNQALAKAVSTILGFLNVAFPVCIMVLCYFRVFRFIKRSAFQVAVQSEVDSRSLETRIKEVKITKTFFAVVLGFLVCWIPVVLTDLLSFNLTNPRFPREGELVFIYFVALSSARNPFIYGVTNRSLRKQFLTALKLRKPVTE